MVRLKIWFAKTIAYRWLACACWCPLAPQIILSVMEYLNVSNNRYCPTHTKGNRLRRDRRHVHHSAALITIGETNTITVRV